ncbi:hypothetical protein FACS1894167_11150 [Synergistales bacterium]|nr:hypothetical protein FACS1894167_11150 [Synergistales bacterium]
MDFSDVIDALKYVSSVAKESEYLKCVEDIRQSGLETLRVEASARREKQSAAIKALHSFDIEMVKLRVILGLAKQNRTESESTALENCISDLEKQRARLVQDKRSV